MNPSRPPPDRPPPDPTDPSDPPDPAAWGVATEYTDAAGETHQVSPATVAAVLAAMEARTPAPAGHGGPLVVRLDRPPVAVPGGWLVTEDGGRERVGGRLPPDLAPGYHRLEPDDGEPRRLIVSPGRCPEPRGSPQWGWSAQLYATRSTSSWGIGDLADLAELARWSASLGAGVALINPLHAAAPGDHQEPSPYFPASRCFPSPLYLRVEDLPGASEVPEVVELGSAARLLNQERLIDRDRVWALKRPALEAVFARFEQRSDSGGLDRFVARRGSALDGFVTWCALAERHGMPWQDWPLDVRRPDAPGVVAFAASAEGASRIRFHRWLQWQLDRQLRAASTAVGIVADLAIGVNVGGADAWLWQDAYAKPVRVGAPPDEFNTRGQDWGLPPFDPWKLRAADYEPFVQTIRGGLRHAGGLRVDHVMGLFRLWWIPEGNPAGAGAYVGYPSDDLLDIVALEAHRAGAYVVGEDLGTVEARVRTDLAERRVLSYRLLWFEAARPQRWPARALGAVTTHDLPTVAGAWTGSDLEVQRALGLAPNEEGIQAMRDRLVQWTASSPATPVGTVVERAYRLLAEAPCALLTATLDDVCGVEERPNMPGTTGEWPNWSLALPLALEDIERLPVAEQVARHLGRRLRS